MNKMHRTLVPLLLAGVAGLAAAQKTKPMQLVEVFDAGQPQAVILKLYDPQAEVICYVLTPERAARKQTDGLMVYEGNNVGAISCVKQRQYVVDVTPSPVTMPAAQEPAKPAAGARQK